MCKYKTLNDRKMSDDIQNMCKLQKGTEMQKAANGTAKGRKTQDKRRQTRRQKACYSRR